MAKVTDRIRKIHSGGVEAALMAYIVDSERENLPVMLSMVGPKNAVKSLTVQAKQPERQGKTDDFAFHIEEDAANSARTTSRGFALPDNRYHVMTKDLSLPPDVMKMPKSHRPTMHEGRIVTYEATSEAGDGEIYVLVRRQIDIPRVEDTQGRNADAIWQEYLRYSGTRYAAEWHEYAPPAWCEDLFNVYAFLARRVRIPISPLWMPWLFERVTRQRWTTVPSMGHEEFIVYVHGYVHPMAAERVPNLEHGAYRIKTDNIRDHWAAILMTNPERGKGITFSKIVPEQIDADRKDRSEWLSCSVCGSRLVANWCHKCKEYRTPEMQVLHDGEVENFPDGPRTPLSAEELGAEVEPDTLSGQAPEDRAPRGRDDLPPAEDIPNTAGMPDVFAKFFGKAAGLTEEELSEFGVDPMNDEDDDDYEEGDFGDDDFDDDDE